MTSPSPTSLADIHPLIIQTQILPRLDGQSLSSVATASSYLRSVTSDDILWSDICKSIWPSITHPRVRQVISTFPAGHRSFFQDSFQPPDKYFNRHHSPLTHWPSEIIFAVDIRYHDDIVFSRVEITDTTADFLPSTLRIVLEEDLIEGRFPFIDLKVDELVNADDAIILHLKESITLNWILIDPTRKRAVNISSIKPVLAWIGANDIHLRFVIVLPGCDASEMFECRIELKLGVGKGGMALHMSEVTLYVQDVACNYLSGKDFLVIISRVLLENFDKKRAALEGQAGSHDQTVGRLMRRNYIIPTLCFLLCFCFLDMLL